MCVIGIIESLNHSPWQLGPPGRAAETELAAPCRMICLLCVRTASSVDIEVSASPPQGWPISPWFLGGWGLGIEPCVPAAGCVALSKLLDLSEPQESSI